MKVDKIYIEKNKLDLEYHKQTQLLNGVMIFATTGVLSFLGTFVWNRDFLLVGAIITGAILFACIIWYNKINRNLKDISEQMGRLT